MAAEERIALERINDFAPAELPLRPYTPDVLLEGNETLDLARITFQTLRVPGHSPAHLAYYADGCLFSGDVLFAAPSVAPTCRSATGTRWSPRFACWRIASRRRPSSIPATVQETTLGDELARNPFLAELRAS
jgi:glyoxylase-like metal-dependent hydrolase (beta-lactamase superfamily II)